MYCKEHASRYVSFRLAFILINTHTDWNLLVPFKYRKAGIKRVVKYDPRLVQTYLNLDVAYWPNGETIHFQRYTVRFVHKLRCWLHHSTEQINWSHSIFRVSYCLVKARHFYSVAGCESLSNDCYLSLYQRDWWSSMPLYHNTEGQIISRWANIFASTFNAQERDPYLVELRTKKIQNQC